MSQYKILAKQKRARVGQFKTPHGDILTPQLAFVATEGEIRSIPKEILPHLPVNLIIVNTFHLWVKQFKSVELVTTDFNIHDFVNFQKPIMSDSGGFQVFSMGFGKAHGIGKVASMFPGENRKWLHGKEKIDYNNPLKISEKGVEFIFNEQKILLTPELSIQLQQKIGADIIFAFDECTSPLNSYQYTKEAMERTHRWLIRCLRQLQKSQTNSNNQNSNSKNKEESENTVSSFFRKEQALFAIVQGGYFEDLRKKSAKFVGRFDVPGFGIGGSLGTTEEEIRDVLDWTIPYLPEEKPRHLLGIGKVRDIFDGVERGVDLFDCVIPTREARHQVLYTPKGKINVRKYRTVNEIADKNCPCQMCQEKITLYKLYELYKLDKLRAFFYATVHNIQFYADLMKHIRFAINKNNLLELREKYGHQYSIA